MHANTPDLLWIGITCAALTAASPGAEPPPGLDRVPNGGFEVDADGDHWPDGWSPSAGLNAELCRQARSGQYSLCVGKAPGGGGASLASSAFVLRPGAAYQVSVWLRMEGRYPQDTVTLRVLTGSGRQSFELHVSRAWRKCTAEFVAAEGAQSGTLEFQQLGDLADRVYLDDVELRETGPADAPRRPVYRTDLTRFQFPEKGSFVEHTSAEMERMRQDMAGRGIRQHPWVKQAEPWLAAQFHFFPEGYASSSTWLKFFNVGMNCPKDGTRLRPEVHADGSHAMKCPRCGEAYRTEANLRCARAVYNQSLLRAASDLARAFALTGDERFARRAKEIMLGFAGRYKTWEPGPHLSFTTLNEAEHLVPFSAAYEYLRDSPALSLQERRTIEEDLFRPLGEFHRRGGIADRMNNRAAIYSRAVMAVGLALRDKRFVDHALNDPHAGFHALSAGIYDADGLCFEGFGYQSYALSGLAPIAEMAYRVGLNVYRDPAYRKIFDAPVHLLLPGEQSQAWASQYAVASQRFHEAGQPLAFPFDGEGRLQAVPSSCYNFRHFGYGVLRSGEGVDQLYLTMEYGKETMFMGHAPAPKFAMLLFANRRLLTPRGAAAYGHPLCGGWSRRSLAHNCITVDDRDQWGRTPGHFIAFECFPRVKVMRAADDETYGGVTLDRTLFLADGYVVDLCGAIAAEGQHRFDLCYRNYGTLTCGLPFQGRSGPLGAAHGYEYLTEVRSARTDAAWSADWRQAEDSGLRLAVAAGPETEVIACSSPDNITQETIVNAVLARRWGRATLFASVWEPYREQPRVSAIRRLAAAERDSELAAAEVTQQGRRGAACFLASYLPGRRRCKDIELDGKIAAGRWPNADAEPEYAMLVRGTLLQRGSHSLEASLPATLYVERLSEDCLRLKTGAGSGGQLTIAGRLAPASSVRCGGRNLDVRWNPAPAITFDALPDACYEIAGVAEWQRIRLQCGGRRADEDAEQGTPPMTAAAAERRGEPAVAHPATPAGTNLLANGDFESGWGPAAAVPSPWESASSYHFVKFRARCQHDREVAHRGTCSLKILQTNWANEATQDGWIEQKLTGGGANRTYTLSAWVKASLAPTKVRLCLYGFRPNWGYDYEGGVSPAWDVGTQWQQITWTRTFGPGITDVHVMVKREHQVLGGDLWIDDMRLEEVQANR
mgnify:CR=1 FL=1